MIYQYIRVPFQELSVFEEWFPSSYIMFDIDITASFFEIIKFIITKFETRVAVIPLFLCHVLTENNAKPIELESESGIFLFKMLNSYFHLPIAT